MVTKKKGYGVLMVITIIVTLLGLATLLPSASASKPCILGYNAFCTFTPISTLIILLGVGIICKVRKKNYTVTQ